MNVLSVFDGMSCGQIALKEAGIKVDKYYASEIDKFAIKQTQHNFPNTIQLGDVRNVHAKDLDRIDLFIGGSPCQGFSFAGKGLNFEDPRSMLFFEFVRLWKEIKEINPDAKFLLENVNMKKSHLRVISEFLEIFPVRINSSLVSAQTRDRWYWTNIKTKHVGFFNELHSDIPQPDDKKILLKDVLQQESEINNKYYLSAKMIKYFNSRAKNFNNGKVNIRNINDKATTITASSKSVDISDNFILTTELNLKNNQGKANCFTAGGNSGGLHSDMDIVCVAMRGRNLENPSDRSKGAKLKQVLELKTDGKTNCLMANQNSFVRFTEDYKLRRLTPTECARLQTIPDWYKWIVSDTQIYKMLGNGWTVDVIKHIFTFYNPKHENIPV